MKRHVIERTANYWETKWGKWQAHQDLLLHVQTGNQLLESAELVISWSTILDNTMDDLPLGVFACGLLVVVKFTRTRTSTSFSFGNPFRGPSLPFAKVQRHMHLRYARCFCGHS